PKANDTNTPDPSARATAAAPEPGKESTAADATDDAAPGPRVKSGDAQDPGERTEGADREAELPPIEPPRSWTKEDKELFTSLPRATQERIAGRANSPTSNRWRMLNV